MGLVRTVISSSNPTRFDLDPVEVETPVDPGASHLRLPQHLAIHLQMDPSDTREVTMADGSRHADPYRGRVAMTCGEPRCLGGAMVFGDEVALGTVPTNGMDLIVGLSSLEVVPTRPIPPYPLR